MSGGDKMKRSLILDLERILWSFVFLNFSIFVLIISIVIALWSVNLFLVLLLIFLEIWPLT